MCGIFGIIVKAGSNYNNNFLKKSLIKLANLSQSRGKDSSGLCNINYQNNSFDIIKGPIPANHLLKRKKVSNSLNSLFSNSNNNKLKLSFGHARLVTNGTQLNYYNNQPVVKDDIICIHNGIVVNNEDLWKNHPKLIREYEIDTEILPALVRLNLNKGYSLDYSVVNAIDKVFGTASIAMTFSDLDKFVLATNNGSLYFIYNDKDLIYFASEKAMLNRFIKKMSLEEKVGKFELFQLKSNNILVLNLKDFTVNINSFDQIKSTYKIEDFLENSRKINFFKEESYKRQISTVLDLNQIHLTPEAVRLQKLLSYPIEKIKDLKRCKKCVLPETFPFIEFDKHGECNYCKNHQKKNQSRSIDELKALVEPYRSNDGSPDCFVPLSGGRDSTYVLHFLKKELDLNVVTYTYDWGMVTDLARRNIARICGELGVENIIVAADIHWKRANINKNLKAWLKNPELGMIPLFMTGDKYFFYYAYKIKTQLQIKLEVLGVNDLENTNFKTGFGGLAPEFNKKRIYSISLFNQLKLYSFILRNVLLTPSYINQSVLDSIGSFAARYVTPKKDYYHLFDYMQWDEKTVEDTIIKNYKWEKSIDTNSTWRIGDGTASFYNYVYTLVAGFSENDTFRSNQIREGMITREEALKLVYDENKPRFNSLKWYLDILNLDFESTIKIINQIPRKY